MKRGNLHALLDIAEQQGCEVSKTRNQHYRLKLPDGVTQLYMGSSPSDWRSEKNFASALRRHGIRVR